MQKIVKIFVMIFAISVLCAGCSHKTYYPKKHKKHGKGGCGCGGYGYTDNKTAVYE